MDAKTGPNTSAASTHFRQGGAWTSIGWVVKKKHTPSSQDAIVMTHRNPPRPPAIHPGAILRFQIVDFKEFSAPDHHEVAARKRVVLYDDIGAFPAANGNRFFSEIPRLGPKTIFVK
jgi:hypothetical protein